MTQNVWQSVSHFFAHSIFNVVGGITIVFSVILIVARISIWTFGISPIIFRLGVALWKRKIAVFGDLGSYESLRTSLIDSRIFGKKNIEHIQGNNIEKAKGMTIFLVDWTTFGARIDDVFSARRDDQTAIVIYALPGSIPTEQMSAIANRPNTVVVNFRGRLLNDVFTSLITTRYGTG